MTEIAVAAPGYLAEETPWRKADVVLSSALGLAGVIALAWSWRGVSGEADFDDQRSWLLLAIGAGAVFGLAPAWWLLAGFRQVRRAQRLFATEVRLVRELPLVSADLVPTILLHSSGDGYAREDALVTGERMTLVHRPTCPMVAGKPTISLNRGQAAARNLGDCRVCSP